MTPVWHHEQRRTAPVGGVKSDAGLMIGFSCILVVGISYRHGNRFLLLHY